MITAMEVETVISLELGEDPVLALAQDEIIIQGAEVEYEGHGVFGLGREMLTINEERFLVLIKVPGDQIDVTQRAGGQVSVRVPKAAAPRHLSRCPGCRY